MVRSFKERMSSFLGSINIPGEEKKEFERDIIRLILQIQEGQGSTRLRKKAYAMNVLEDFSYFKTHYLDVSHHIHRRLWKAIVFKIKGEKEPQEDLAKDVEYCISKLDGADIQRVKEIEINNELNTDELTLDSWEMGRDPGKRRNLMTHCKSKVYTLNYLNNYDPSFSGEDFTQELLCEAARVFNTYGRSKGRNLALHSEDAVKTRVEQYMEKALNNKVKNIKEYNTCESRRRVSTTDKHLYKEREKIKKSIRENPDSQEHKDRLKEIEQQISHSNGDYYGTVTSLSAADDSGGRDKTIDYSEAKLVDSGIITESHASKRDNNLWLAGIIAKLEDSIVDMFVSCCLDEDPDFIRYKKIKKIPNNSEDMVFYIMKYLDLGTEDINHISTKLGDADFVSDYLHMDDYDMSIVKSIITKAEGKPNQFPEPRSMMFVKLLNGYVYPEFEAWAGEKRLDLNVFNNMVDGVRKYLGFTKNTITGNRVIKRVIFPELRNFIDGYST